MNKPKDIKLRQLKRSFVHKTCATWGVTECGLDRFNSQMHKVTERWDSVSCPKCLEYRPKKKRNAMSPNEHTGCGAKTPRSVPVLRQEGPGRPVYLPLLQEDAQNERKSMRTLEEDAECRRVEQEFHALCTRICADAERHAAVGVRHMLIAVDDARQLLHVLAIRPFKAMTQAESMAALKGQARVVRFKGVPYK